MNQKLLIPSLKYKPVISFLRICVYACNNIYVRLYGKVQIQISLFSHMYMENLVSAFNFLVSIQNNNVSTALHNAYIHFLIANVQFYPDPNEKNVN